jgi:hypothetical protein
VLVVAFGAGPAVNRMTRACFVLLHRPAVPSGLTSVEALTTPQGCAHESTPTSGSPRLWLQLSKVSLSSLLAGLVVVVQRGLGLGSLLSWGYKAARGSRITLLRSSA